MRHTKLPAKAEEKIVFGQLHQVSKELAELSCNSVFDCTVDILLQDVEGRVVLNKMVNVSQATHSISLDVSKMEDGSYYAWISVGESTFLRNLTIKHKNVDSNNGVKDILAKLFT